MLNKVDKLDNLEKLRNKLEKVKILNKKNMFRLIFFILVLLTFWQEKFLWQIGNKKIYLSRILHTYSSILRQDTLHRNTYKCFTVHLINCTFNLI